MKTIALFMVLMISAGCVKSQGHEFFMTERHSGHRFGPFQYGEGDDVIISGNQFRISIPAVSHKELQLITKMKSTILPTFDAVGAHIRDTICYLSTTGSINIILDLEPNEPDPWGDDQGSNMPLVTLKVKDISVYDALNIVCEMADVRWTIENSVVMIRNKKAPLEDFAEEWKYDGGFHDLMDVADKIVIRNGGYNCCGSVDANDIILTITNANEIAEFNSMLQFETNQTWNSCWCCGFPGIDWYRGKYRLALTGVQHGRALRWKGFPGDASFTKQSSLNLAQWSLDHNLPDPHKELIKIVGEAKQ